MRDKIWKKYQSKLNKKIKILNKDIAEDNLWRGRFIFRQIEAGWEKFDDKSGILRVVIRAYDKKTKLFRDYFLDYCPSFVSIEWFISMDICNDFIINFLQVWKYEDPYKESFDWTSVDVNDETFRRR